MGLAAVVAKRTRLAHRPPSRTATDTLHVHDSYLRVHRQKLRYKNGDPSHCAPVAANHSSEERVRCWARSASTGKGIPFSLPSATTVSPTKSWKRHTTIEPGRNFSNLHAIT